MFSSASHSPRKRKKLPYILLGVFLFLVLLGGTAYYAIQHIGIEKLLSSSFLQQQITKRVGSGEGDIFELLPAALGFDEPKTYLVLFLNNTEIRPGGGFIGVYGTVRVSQGSIEVLKVEGTELLDNQSSDDNVPLPPGPLAEYLKVSGWYFRDSNWSPDFAESSKQGLVLYARENGVASGDIDAVIGVTATVLEELMTKTGQITINGITFTPENVVAELEHEVEYKFIDRGISRGDRKDIIEPFMLAMIDKLKSDVLRHPFEYRALAEKLLQQKHIVAYALDPNIQSTLHEHSADGSIADTNGDYLMWVDANLGALKTDHAIKRTLSYSIEPRVLSNGDHYYEATATMKYVHSQPFDWRTSRYRTYARVFVPQGSELISTVGSMKTDRSLQSGIIDSGVEKNKQWFGTFVSIEPLTTQSLTFTYRLPDSITASIDKDVYTLLVQKQIGLVGSSLTLNLDFDTTIQGAEPSEVQSEWGDDVYRIDTQLAADLNFEVTLK
ncbi:MAG TPA: DUF4012 domain-containing protein [Candidatus Magasanikbacteria bacterium]|nr:DUF4012 domain-containing protein [Candidatus Magasanikbacteria bacterium]